MSSNDIEYYTCDRCNGIGYIDKDFDVDCPKCLGYGKLNWLENIFGKDPSKLSYEEILNRVISSQSGKLAAEIDKAILEQILGSASINGVESIKKINRC